MASGRKEVHQDAPTQTPQRSWGGLLRRIPAPCKTSVGGSGRKGGITKSSNTEKHNVSQGHPPDKGHGLAHARWGPTISPNDRNRIPQRARANKAVPKPQQPAPDQDRRRGRGRAIARPRPRLRSWSGAGCWGLGTALFARARWGMRFRSLGEIVGPQRACARPCPLSGG